MKLVLSRKGFDSATGECPSPILPCGRMVSLPIPYRPGAQKRYNELKCDSANGLIDLGTLVHDLSRRRIVAEDFAHADPDLDHGMMPRLPGWRGAFGQVEAAQSHLANQKIGVGDIFLFHGWFRAVERARSGQWQYQRNAPHLSVMFGWLQVAEVIDLEQQSRHDVLSRHPWLKDHPHLYFPAHLKFVPSSHAIYVASEKLVLPGVGAGATPGAGVFPRFDRRLVLTAENQSRSVWKLPAWFKGSSSQPWLTNYVDSESWHDRGDHVLLRPRGRRGQEAVLDCANRAEAAAWLAGLISAAWGKRGLSA